MILRLITEMIFHTKNKGIMSYENGPESMVILVHNLYAERERTL